jgi:hypothetical protein
MSDVKRYVCPGAYGRGPELDPGEHWVAPRFVLATDYDALKREALELLRQIDKFAEEFGEADFYTGGLRKLLKMPPFDSETEGKP